MQIPQHPRNEGERLEALRRLDILDTPPEERFDRITRTASRALGVPMALVSLIDDDRQWFKSRRGLDATETPRDISFCGHAILGDEILVTPDAQTDPRFSDNPLVTGAPHIRFYAGCPVRDPDGMSLGTLCVLDTESRLFDDEQLAMLRDLAAMVEHELVAVELLSEVREREKVEGELRVVTSRLHALVSNLSAGVLFENQERRVRYANQAFCDLFGVSVPPEQLYDMDCSESALQTKRMFAEPEAFIKDVDRCLSEQAVVLGDELVLCDARVFERDYVPVAVDGMGRGHLWQYRDITERKRLDTMKSDFIATVSHELRTPLTSIIGALGLTIDADASDLSDQYRSLATIAHNNSLRLARLVDDILDIDKLQSGNVAFDMVVTDLLPLVETALQANRPFADRLHVDLVLGRAARDIAVETDTHRFIQLMTNLISNAAKFSPAGDKVTVHADDHDGRARVSVTDNGPGIPESAFATLFDRFTQVDSSNTRGHKGTGLGLAISKAIVERLGGHIGLTSEVGVGTTFHFDMPIHTSG